MHLWSEYEGRTIAGAYNLTKLLRSEGRNAFFTTSDKQKHGAVIRLTEAHFDEDEMLKRWRHVAAVDQHYLLAIREVGQTNVDDVAMAYALLEPSDADLADVLRERPLTPAETLEVARSVVSALLILHKNGLVHEHVQTTNILAVGETVKLRSDCVRECVADQEFTTPEQCDALRLRDIHDLGVVLLQCLTLETEWSPALTLPDPFAQLIPGALDGSWSLGRIAFAVGAAETAESKERHREPAGVNEQAPLPVQPDAPQSVAARAEEPARLVPAEVLQARADKPASRSTLAEEGSASGTTAMHRHSMPREQPRSVPTWMLPLAGILLVVLLGWYLAAHRPARPQAVGPISQAGAGAAPVNAAVSSGPGISALTAAAQQPAVAGEAGRAGKGWYVVAYTYNHRAQAEAKAVRLRRNHSSLRPQVISPSGQGPFLVTLGGPMNRPQAEETLRHARRSGLPRDTFVRNY